MGAVGAVGAVEELAGAGACARISINKNVSLPAGQVPSMENTHDTSYSTICKNIFLLVVCVFFCCWLAGCCSMQARFFIFYLLSKPVASPQTTHHHHHYHLNE